MKKFLTYLSLAIAILILVSCNGRPLQSFLHPRGIFHFTNPGGMHQGGMMNGYSRDTLYNRMSGGGMMNYNDTIPGKTQP